MTKAGLIYLFILAGLLAALPSAQLVAANHKRLLVQIHTTYANHTIRTNIAGKLPGVILHSGMHNDPYTVQNGNNQLPFIAEQPIVAIAFSYKTTFFTHNEYEPIGLDNRLLHIYPFHHFW
ncbi:MAG: hypothetical protein QM731_19475 [Chitinophagaceae bacterium]